MAVWDGSAGLVIVGPTPKIGPIPEVAVVLAAGIAMLIDVSVAVVVGTEKAGPGAVLEGGSVTTIALLVGCCGSWVV